MAKMKFFVFLGILAMQCATTKSWHGDSYIEEVPWPLGWIGYLRRFFLLTILAFGILLYYVPESRPYVRRVCFIIIDIVASTLKLALGANEAEILYEEMKPNETRLGHRHSWSAKKSFEDMKYLEATERTRSSSAKILASDSESAREREKKGATFRRSKEEKLDRVKDKNENHNTISKDVSRKSWMEALKPFPHPVNTFPDPRKYLRPRLSDSKGFEGANLDNFIVLISGNSRHMDLAGKKHTKSNLEIAHDHYSKLEFKDSSTLANNRLINVSESKKGYTKSSNSEREKLEIKQSESNVPPEMKNLRYSAYNSSKVTNQYQSQECNVSNYSPSSMRDNYAAAIADLDSTATKENEVHGRYSHNSSQDSKKLHGQRRSRNHSAVQKRNSKNHDKNGTHEKSIKRASKMWPPNDNISSGACCGGSSCCVDPEEEPEDEVSSSKEEETANHDLDDDRPQWESLNYPEKYENQVYFNYNFSRVSMDMTDSKPTLLRAVDWIFGSCPGAVKEAKLKEHEVGKEASQGVTSGWLL